MRTFPFPPSLFLRASNSQVRWTDIHFVGLLRVMGLSIRYEVGWRGECSLSSNVCIMYHLSIGLASVFRVYFIWSLTFEALKSLQAGQIPIRAAKGIPGHRILSLSLHKIHDSTCLPDRLTLDLPLIVLLGVVLSGVHSIHRMQTSSNRSRIQLAQQMNPAEIGLIAVRLFFLLKSLKVLSYYKQMTEIELELRACSSQAHCSESVVFAGCWI